MWKSRKKETMCQILIIEQDAEISFNVSDCTLKNDCINCFDKGWCRNESTNTQHES